jgi:t-SNARE complex subunit (syntaxin)
VFRAARSSCGKRHPSSSRASRLGRSVASHHTIMVFIIIIIIIIIIIFFFNQRQSI